MAEENSETLFSTLALTLTRGIRRRDIFALLKTGRNVDALFTMSLEEIEASIGRKLKSPPDFEKGKRAAEKALKTASLRGIKIVTYTEAGYPPLLRESYDPPALLYYRGALPAGDKSLLAMVGTRHPSSEGRSWSYNCAAALGEAGVAVVSGLALGIDAASHRGNIEGGGKSIAVLGSGVDEIYPASNKMLAKRILETGGAIVSEYPLGSRPAQWTFPERNRIISGLARGVVIAEAPVKSGALITARYALEDNRDLWVGKAGMREIESCAGTRNLAEQGAPVLENAEDILKEWSIPFSAKTEKNAELKKAFSIKNLAEDLKTELGLE